MSENRSGIFFDSHCTGRDRNEVMTVPQRCILFTQSRLCTCCRVCTTAGDIANCWSSHDRRWVYFDNFILCVNRILQQWQNTQVFLLLVTRARLSWPHSTLSFYVKLFHRIV